MSTGSIADALASQQRRRQMQLREAAEMAQAGPQRAGHRQPSADGGNSMQRATHEGPVRPPSEQRILAAMQRLYPTAMYLALRRRTQGGPNGQPVGPARRWRKPLPWVFSSRAPALPASEPGDPPQPPDGPTERFSGVVSSGNSRGLDTVEAFKGNAPLSPPSADPIGSHLGKRLELGCQGSAAQAASEGAQSAREREPVQGQQRQEQHQPARRKPKRIAAALPKQRNRPAHEGQRHEQQQPAQRVLPPPLRPLHVAAAPPRQPPPVPSVAPPLNPEEELQPTQPQTMLVPPSLQRERAKHQEQQQRQHDKPRPPPPWQVRQQQAGWYPFGNLLLPLLDGANKAAADAAAAVVIAATGRSSAADAATLAKSSPRDVPPPVPRPPAQAPASATSSPRLQSSEPQSKAVESSPRRGRETAAVLASARGSEAFGLSCTAVHVAWSYLYDKDGVEKDKHLEELEGAWGAIQQAWGSARQHRQRDSLIAEPWPPSSERRACNPKAATAEALRASALAAARQTDDRLQQLLRSRPPLAELLLRGLGGGLNNGPGSAGFELLESVAALDVLRPGLLEADAGWQTLVAAAHAEQQPDLSTRIRRKLRGTGLEGVATPAGMVLHAAIVGLLLLDASPEPHIDNNNHDAVRRAGCGGERRVYECAVLGVLHLEASRRRDSEQADAGRWRLALSPMQLYHAICFDTFVVCRPDAVLVMPPPVPPSPRPDDYAASRSRHGASADTGSGCCTGPVAAEQHRDHHHVRRRLSRFAPEYFRHLLAICLPPSGGVHDCGRSERLLLLQIACSTYARDWALTAPSLPSAWEQLEAVLLDAVAHRRDRATQQLAQAPLQQQPRTRTQQHQQQPQLLRPGLSWQPSPRELVQPSPRAAQAHQGPHPQQHLQAQARAALPQPDPQPSRLSLLQRVRQAGLLEQPPLRQCKLQSQTPRNGQHASPRMLPVPSWAEPPQVPHQQHSPPLQRHEQHPLPSHRREPQQVGAQPPEQQRLQPAAAPHTPAEMPSQAAGLRPQPDAQQRGGPGGPETRGLQLQSGPDKPSPQADGQLLPGPQASTESQPHGGAQPPAAGSPPQPGSAQALEPRGCVGPQGTAAPQPLPRQRRHQREPQERPQPLSARHDQPQLQARPPALHQQHQQTHFAPPPNEAEVRLARQLYAGLLRPPRCDSTGREQLRCVLGVLRLAAQHGLLDVQHGPEVQGRATALLRRVAAAAQADMGAGGGGQQQQPYPGCGGAFVERYSLAWGRGFKAQRRLGLFMNGALPEEGWADLARELRPGLLERFEGSWGRLLSAVPGPAEPAAPGAEKQQAQKQRQSRLRPGRKGVRQQQGPGEQDQRHSCRHEQQQQQLKLQQGPQRGWLRRWVSGLTGAWSKPSAPDAAAAAAATTSGMAGETTEVVEEAETEQAGTQQGEAAQAAAMGAEAGRAAAKDGEEEAIEEAEAQAKEEAAGDEREADLLPADRRKLARAALWGLAALVGFEVPLQFLSLACCLAAGACMMGLALEPGADTTTAAVTSADLFRCLAFLPPLPYLPREDAWLAAVLLPASETEATPEAAAAALSADLPLNHPDRQQRILEQLEYGIRLWLSDPAVAGLLTECVMPPSMALAQGPQRQLLLAALRARQQQRRGARGDKGDGGDGNGGSGERNGDGGGGMEEEEEVLGVEGSGGERPLCAGARAGAGKDSRQGRRLFWGGRW